MSFTNYNLWYVVPVKWKFHDLTFCFSFKVTALWLASGQIPATTLGVLINEHQVKDGTALEFLLETMATLKTEKGGPMVVNVIKKSGNFSLKWQFHLVCLLKALFNQSLGNIIYLIKNECFF